MWAPNKLNRSGSVLVFSLIILAITLVSALTIAGTAVVNQKESLSTARTNQAFQVADSAVETALKRIYRDDDATPAALATAAGGSCDGGIITGLMSQGSYEITLYDNANALIPCDRTTWRDEVVRLRSEGTLGDTARVIETAVAATGGLKWAEFTVDASNTITAGPNSGLDATDTQATIVVSDPYIGGEDLWGLRCQTAADWIAIGCGWVQLTDQTVDRNADLVIDNNACLTDNEERGWTPSISIRCLKHK
jgi:type II secretory pathway pseudopilin PulG